MTVQDLNLVANMMSAFVGFFTALVALFALFKAREVKVLVDGQFTEMKLLIAKLARAEGVIEGKAEERANPT